MTTATLTTRTIGETENALRALLGEILAGTALDYPRWVALRLLAAHDRLSPTELSEQIESALKAEEGDGRAIIAALTHLGLVADTAGTLTLSEAGDTLLGRITESVDAQVSVIWSGLDAADLAAAGRVMTVIRERAGERLADLRARAR